MPSKPFSVAQIRQTFLDFFAARGHTVVPSGPLVPSNDPTLMFTNSGMVQFKDVFLGKDLRSYKRAVSVQACLRAGGKHNDLENVGYTARHHTFFEMLGNWSFGDYFKRESLHWGWELLTKEFGLPAERLMATVYCEDHEAYDIWTKEIGLPPERVVRIGDKNGKKYASDNFWMMAETGPCGPCSEIFYDHGPEVAGGPPGSPDEDGDRYIEIWNHVFMQYEIHADGSLTRLPAPCVDTGMGVERLAAILQHVHSNYEIDLFQTLIVAAGRVTQTSDLSAPSLKVIADHVRASCFLVADGVIPGNEGRGYVQRRIIRRAIRHGYKLGQKTPFLYALVPKLVALMAQAYPHLQKYEQTVAQTLKTEELRFYETLQHGMELLETYMSLPAFALAQMHRTQGWETQGHVRPQGAYGLSQALQDGRHVHVFVWQPGRDLGVALLSAGNLYGIVTAQQHVAAAQLEFPQAHILPDSSVPRIMDGQMAFMLHDTYGFPLDLTQDACREQGAEVDVAGFEKAMQKQKLQARAAGKFRMERALEYTGAENVFMGYEHLEVGSLVVALYHDGVAVPTLKAGQNGVVVLDITPFYAESGGQVGDSGLITQEHTLGPEDEGDAAKRDAAMSPCFSVHDTQKIRSGVHGHFGVLLQGELKVGDSVRACVDAKLRSAIMRNHSVTHLLHKALRKVLGSHVQQKGSLVNAERTRFDFSHMGPLSQEQVGAIELDVNQEILSNAAVQIRHMSLAEAKQTGAQMLFGEKYGETVRVLDIGTTVELCGGTHVERCGDIGMFRIVAQEGVAAGIRRVEGVSGLGALAYTQQQNALLDSAAAAIKSTPAALPERLRQLQEQLKAGDKALQHLQSRLALAQGEALLGLAVQLPQAKMLVDRIDGLEAHGLRETAQHVRGKLGIAVVVLATVNHDKIQIAAAVSKELHSQVKAGVVVGQVAAQVGGKGGGKPDLAMAGGTQVENLDDALLRCRSWLTEQLQASVCRSANGPDTPMPVLGGPGCRV